MKITTQNIYGIELKETENGFTFASSACKLDFKPNGTLRGMTIGDLALTERSDAKPVTITTGGNYRSTIDPTGKNKNWASLTGENMTHETPDVTLKNARLVRTMLTVELHLTLNCGKVEIEDIFALKQGEKGLTRKFTVTNNSDEALTLRSVTLTLPSIPEGTEAHPAGGFKPAIIETGKGTIAAWYDPRYDAENLDGNLTYMTRVESDLAPGDTVSAPGYTLSLVDGDKYEAAGYVRERLEEKGLRARNTNREKLTSLTCYEVEIGPLRLSETRCHHRYDHPSELAADLERIHSLGFNTLEMMPSFLFPCYTVYDLMNPDIQHGAGESIKPVIDRAHELGMNVILDILMHGCIDTEIADWDRERYISRRYYWPEWQKKIPELFGEERAKINPLREEHPDWFIFENKNDIFKGYTWTFDHAAPGFIDWFARAMEKSVTEWKVDGFRFDAPPWQSGVSSRENLPYSGQASVNYGHCATLRAARERVEKIRPDVIFIVEGPYYEYADSCDMAYSYDQYYNLKNVYDRNKTARGVQEYLRMRSAIFPHGSLWLNFADNHDTFNNGVVEDALYSVERFGEDFTKVMLFISVFSEGALQAFGGFEEKGNMGALAKEMISERVKYAAILRRPVEYDHFASDENILVMTRRAEKAPSAGEYPKYTTLDTVANLSDTEREFTIDGREMKLGAYECALMLDGKIVYSV